jgi:sugar/nucleoside kinase (ribokinase family)
MSKINADIIIAGNIICHVIKTVFEYPKCGNLADITAVKRCVGGCAPNTSISLAALKGVSVAALGKVGRDECGAFVLDKLKSHGVNVSGVIFGDRETSFTDVMSIEGGERTFFHSRGANAEFSPSDINLDNLNCKILHLGYLMLLDKFDEESEEFTTKAAEFLKRVRERGIKTSIDTVSKEGANFKRAAAAAFKYCDYVIINEVEAGEIAGICPRDKNGELIESNVKKILSKLMDLGVKEKVIVHCPEAGFCLDCKLGFKGVESLKLPKGYIKGKVGAGDAFCAGALYGILKGFSDEQTLTLASCSAAANLSVEDSVSGARSFEETMRIVEVCEN